MQQIDDPDGVNVLKTLFFELESDAGQAIELASSDPSQFNKRAAFRAFFAAVEGVTRALKHQVALRFPQESDSYSDAERTLLREENYCLNDRGEAKTRQAVIPPKSNFIFALKMFMREMPIQLELGLKTEGWQAFNESLKVRHRVTHPTKPSDIEVADKEFEQLCTARHYILGTVTRNIAKALLEYRHREYLRWDKGLPEQVLKWFDLLPEWVLSHDLEKSIDTSDSGFPGQNGIGPSDQQKLFVIEGSEILLTMSGKDYCKWRRRNAHYG